MLRYGFLLAWLQGIKPCSRRPVNNHALPKKKISHF